ncbi:MAG TPA: hypothetical protein VKV03_15350 [Candidatus Binataceae bacterium]|nr:hypothetical protein [Candidatus Binataceae bacterium]
MTNLPARFAIFAIIVATIAISVGGCAARRPGGAPEAGPLIEGPISPYAIAIGPDDNIWFTEYQGDRIRMMTPNGQVTRFPIASDGIAERITGGPDAALWFTDPKGNRIGRIAIDGKIKYVKLPTPECGPTGITTGADGLIYFSEHAANRIGRMTIDGTLAEFTLRAHSGPAEMVTGNDGAVYFIEDEAGRIGKITRAGAISEVAIPTAHSIPSGIASGPGGIYFAELSAEKIGKLNLDLGTIEEYSIVPRGKPLGLAVGPDGNLWMTTPDQHSIRRMSPHGHFSTYGGSALLSPSFIAAARAEYLYFSEPNGKIGRINAEGDIVEFEVGK